MFLIKKIIFVNNDGKIPKEWSYAPYTVVRKIVGNFSTREFLAAFEIEFRHSSSILFHVKFHEESNNIGPRV